MLRGITIIAFGLALLAGSAAANEPFDVPKLQNIKIDGDVSDWGDHGFRLDILSTTWAARRDRDNGSARVRLAWDDKGLLLRFNVKDDKFVEAGYEEIWMGDCIELFTTTGVGAHGFVQYLVLPGMATAQSKLRYMVKDERDLPTFDPSKLVPEMARKAADGGYVMEVRLPWDAFNMKQAREGQVAALTFNVSDIDRKGGARLISLWHPQYGVWGGNTHRMCAFRLSTKTVSPPVVAIASTRYADYAQNLAASLTGVAELAGKVVDVRSGDKRVASFTLTENGGWTTGTAILPSPGRDATPRLLKFVVDGRIVATAQPRSVGAIFARRILDELNPTFEQHVFSSNRFPKVRLSQPLVIEKLIGPYDIKVTFYSSDFREVTEASTPGRYGAVVQIIPKSGRPYTRYRTLYRTPERFRWRNLPSTGGVSLPRQFGVAPAVAQKQGDAISGSLKTFMATADKHGDAVAAMLAGLSEMSPDAPPANAFNNVEALNRQWWVTLKRKIQGTGERWPKGMDAPTKINGKAAMVLHEGTMKEAGMVADAPQRIDTMLTQWSKDSDEAFIAVVVRNGVVVLHKAYGVRDGKPMTVDTPSRMASLTKLMNGASMMMLVDRGLVNLDAPISTYLPAFNGRRATRPIIVRDLFVHTAGMWGHWGDDLHDFDLRVAEYAPYLEVGKRFGYNGMDLAMGGKIMEAVTGRSLPNYYREYLFRPLGMTRTEATRGGTGARSVAMDMAKFGQMLCNGGSYGDQYFFSPKTLEKMLPRRLTKVLGKDAGKVWGIGTEWLDRNYLSDRTFGHGSAAMATLRIDLENKLVVSMTRNRAGENFNKYHGIWLATVADCMIDPKLSDRARQGQAKRRGNR